jgi:hypothetical protein
VVKVAPAEGFDNAQIEKDVVAKLVTAVEMRARLEFVPMEEIYDPVVALKAYRVLDMRPKDM